MYTAGLSPSGIRSIMAGSLLPLTIPEEHILREPASLFLFLTQGTAPHKSETFYYGQMLSQLGFEIDLCGNWFKEILRPNGERPTTCFMCHLDTVSREPEEVCRIVEDGVCGTDGSTILGADDRAGLTVLLYMTYRKVPGLYYLFTGEENGCIGSSKAAVRGLIPSHYNKAVSFDREGCTSVITHQINGRTCSDEFASHLCNELNKLGLEYRPDPNGVFTDSNEFRLQIPECTNISVGFTFQHTAAERQDLVFLEKLCYAVCLVWWESLAIDRVPGDIDYDEFDWDEMRFRNWGGSEQRLTASSEAVAIQAIDHIVDDFQMARDFDRAMIQRLVSADRGTTADRIEVLLEDLQRLIFWKEDH